MVVMIDEIDETGKIEGASKLLEFLASKQRKAGVCLVLAGQRATATWTGGSGVRINLSTVVTGLLARDSEARHAVGAENEIPDIAEYSRGEAGFFQIWDVRVKRIRSRGRGFFMGKIGEQRDKIIARRDPAARPALKGAGETTAPAPAAPQEHAGSGLRERLAHARELNEGRPLLARPGALPVVPSVPPEDMPVLLQLLAAPGGTTAAAAGLALGKSKQSALNYLTALRDRGVATQAGAGRGHRWHLVRAAPGAPREPVPEPAPTALQPRPYLTLENLAEFVLNGLMEADDEQRAILEQAHDMIRRKRLTLVKDDGDDTP